MRISDQEPPVCKTCGLPRSGWPNIRYDLRPDEQCRHEVCESWEIVSSPQPLARMNHDEARRQAIAAGEREASLERRRIRLGR